HALQDAGLREPRLHADVHARPAPQGLPARPRGRPRPRGPDAGRRRRRAGRASLVGNGYDDVDFAALLEYEAKASGLDLKPEDASVGDGLSDNGAARNGDGDGA